MAPDEVKLRKQVDYYFSDSNFPRDKFLRQKSEEDENGFVDISVLLTFNRLKEMGASVETISSAASSSKVVTLDDSKMRLRRKDPLPDENLWKTRTIYAKGWIAGSPFPSIDELTELFSPSGEVLMVKRRYWKDDDGTKNFKGSIFVEFASPEAAERAAAEEYPIQVKDEETGKMVDKKLIILMMEDYFVKKKEEKRAYYARRKERMQQKKEEKAKSANGNGTATEKENGNNALDEGKTDKMEDKVKTEAKGEDKMDVVKSEVKSEAKSEAKPETEAVVKEEAKVEEGSVVKNERRPENVTGNLIRGLVIRIEGVDPDTRRDEIREAFKEHGNVTWVEHKTGNSGGYVRFSEKEMAAAAVEKMNEKKTEINGKVLTLKLLEGEEEESYWKNLWDMLDRQEKNKEEKKRKWVSGEGRGRGGKRRRGGYRGGRGRGRGRK